MKYILINPEVIDTEVNGENGIYGPGGLISRINFNKAELELNMLALIINPCKECTREGKQEVDITEAFEPQKYGINPGTARTQLKKILDIVKFDNSDNGEGIVYVKYMTPKEWSEKTQDEKESINERYRELQDRLDKLAPKEYSPEEKLKIASYIVKRYTEDLLQREDIVFNYKPFLDSEKIGDIMDSGTGKTYHPKDLTYDINDERYIVRAYIFPTLSKLAFPPDYRMPDKGAIQVFIQRKSQDGQIENLAECQKSVSENSKTVVRCKMGDLRYAILYSEDSSVPNTYIIENENPEEYKYAYLSEEEFLKFSENMLRPESIDSLYEALISKTRFQFLDKSSKQKPKPTRNGVREVGDWPQQGRPTHLDFEAIMSGDQIVEHMKYVKPEDLTEKNLVNQGPIQQ